MRGRTVILAVELVIIRLVFLEHVVDGGQQHSGNGDNRFLVASALFQILITVKDFWVFLLRFNGGKGALYEQRLDVGPSAADPGGFFFPALSLFCGVSPAQEQQCFEVGNMDIFTPISEMMPIAAKDWIPGAVITMLS